MKRIFSLICLGAVLIAVVFCFTKKGDDHIKDTDYIEPQFLPIEPIDSPPNPNYMQERWKELREEWGDELFEECLKGNPAGWVVEDPVTGEKRFVDPDDLPDPEPSPPPYIPEGLEVAPSPFESTIEGTIDSAF